MKIGKFLYRLLLLIILAAMLTSGSVLLRDFADSLQQKQASEELAALVERSRTAPVFQTVPADSRPAVTVPAILPEYAALYEENSDLVGWMSIDGTSIHYPVMQTPDWPDYYLHRNFKQERSSHGCLYVREACDVFAPSDNLTIYGHHMRDGSMFTSLEKYRREDFYEKYPSIQFDTLYERHTYTVFAVFTTTASLDKGFPYHLFVDAAGEEEFDNFVSRCKDLSLYDTGITPRYGDKLLCLSTCEYTNTNGRLVVAAVRD